MGLGCGAGDRGMPRNQTKNMNDYDQPEVDAEVRELQEGQRLLNETLRPEQ